ncbi:MAG: hypothetical protein ACOX6N_05225 [Patescibacteria group bacterium]|jgi:hypothetical protein
MDLNHFKYGKDDRINQSKPGLWDGVARVEFLALTLNQFPKMMFRGGGNQALSKTVIKKQNTTDKSEIIETVVLWYSIRKLKRRKYA